MSAPPLTPDAVGLVELCERLRMKRFAPTSIHNHSEPVNPDGPEAAALIQSQAARIADLEAGHNEIMCWFGEAAYTFPDWKSCADALATISENVMDGLPPLATAEDRQARSLLSGEGEKTRGDYGASACVPSVSDDRPVTPGEGVP